MRYIIYNHKINAFFTDCKSMFFFCFTQIFRMSFIDIIYQIVDLQTFIFEFFFNFKHFSLCFVFSEHCFCTPPT